MHYPDRVDAFGNELIIGHVYAYSQTRDGLTTNVLGRLLKISDDTGRASIQAFKRKSFLHAVQTPICDGLGQGGPGIGFTVFPCILFPMSEEFAEQQNQEV